MTKIKDYAGSMVSAEKDKKVGRQISVTLSDMAFRESAIAALGKGLNHATLLRNQLEVWHESPGFASMLRRSHDGLERRIKEGTLSEQDLRLLKEIGYEIDL